MTPDGVDFSFLFLILYHTQPRSVLQFVENSCVLELNERTYTRACNCA